MVPHQTPRTQLTMATALPTLPDVQRGNAWDMGRFVTWTVKNLLHDHRARAPWLGPVWLLWSAWLWLAAPVFWLLYLAVSTAQRKTFYYNQDKTAVIGIRTRRSTWILDDHIAATRGAGQGRQLRSSLIGPMLEAADARAITVKAVADNEYLAAMYRTDVPGLETIRTRRNGKVELRRAPGAAPRGQAKAFR